MSNGYLAGYGIGIVVLAVIDACIVLSAVRRDKRRKEMDLEYERILPPEARRLV